MRGIPERSAVFGALVLATAAVSSCKTAPPAYPSALVVVDTDLPVPSVIARLQIDVFDERGTWSQHHRFAFARRDEWPPSFGVYLPDDSRAIDVLVRIRGYADGGERDYIGERPADVAPYVPLPYAKSVAEMCASAPVVPPLETRALVAGPDPLFDRGCIAPGDRVPFFSRGGSVAALVDVPTQGRYRFEVLAGLGVTPEQSFAFAQTLLLGRDCRTPSTYVACDVELDQQSNTVARIEQDLDPGRYALVTAGWFTGSMGYVALRWGPSSQWGTPTLPAFPVAPVAPATPLRLAQDGRDVTPDTEPAPASSIDRLVRLHLAPGSPAHVRVILRGTCAGASAKLAIRDDGTVDAGASTTCIDDPSAFVAAPFASSDDTAEDAPSLAGSFVHEPCADGDSDAEHVCVPGGAFVLGTTTPGLSGYHDEDPPRIAALHRFWIDRHEYTVARFRTSGVKPEVLTEGPVATDGPLAEGPVAGDATYSTKPLGRESFPLTATPWTTARRLCLAAGGDLPSEAQWEYAATYGGDGAPKRVYPTGDAPLDCTTSVLSRSAEFAHQCGREGTPTAVDADDLAGDVSFLGIVGLAGNVSEQVLSSGFRYDEPCWRGAGVVDPVCYDPALPSTVQRGGSWAAPVAATRGAARLFETAHNLSAVTGFRCAYRSGP